LIDVKCTRGTLLQLVDTKSHDAQWNMDWDAARLEELDPEEEPILHFYEWEKPSISYGHFLDPKKFLHFPALEKHHIDLGKRPTGGGITFHLWDFAFSLLVPAKSQAFSENPLENYQRVNRAILSLAEGFLKQRVDLQKEDAFVFEGAVKNFCMARPTKYDVVVQGKKVAGAAQRKTRNGFLHQGTIFLVPPDFQLLEELLLPNDAVVSSAKASLFPLFPKEANLLEARSQIKELLFEALRKNLQ
jgi:lipoate---protein ligase